MSTLNKLFNYKFFSILFLLFSLVGSVYLVKLRQDLRNQAVGNGECACKDIKTGVATSGQCKNDGSCVCPAGTNPGTNKCVKGPAGDVPSVDDKCVSGQTVCQKNSSGKNTGYLCKCLVTLDPNDWQCTTQDLKTCPAEGGVAPNAGYCDPTNKVKIEGRCLKSDPGYSMSVVYKYTCPNKFSDLGGGCQQNEKIVRNTSSVCFESNFCGAQQIDMQGGSCFISVVDYSGCQSVSPTISKKPTNTPSPTVKPTIKPTITITPTISRTPTLTFTPTPTTIVPTLTQTPTISVTTANTPTVTPTNKTLSSTPTMEAVSPTRIILPSAGVEFPIQAVTVIGIITTLLGFLILL